MATSVNYSKNLMVKKQKSPKFGINLQIFQNLNLKITLNIAYHNYLKNFKFQQVISLNATNLKRVLAYLVSIFLY